MRNKIQDQYTNLSVSKQRKWALRHPEKQEIIRQRFKRNIKAIVSRALHAQARDICESLPKQRLLNKDNPQYVMGWNACLFLMTQAIEKIKKGWGYEENKKT